jgi:hypothetical protein
MSRLLKFDDDAGKAIDALQHRGNGLQLRGIKWRNAPFSAACQVLRRYMPIYRCARKYNEFKPDWLTIVTAVGPMFLP